jgi:very-short-patch-repair endonuclease
MPPLVHEGVSLPTEDKKALFSYYWRIFPGGRGPQPIEEFYFARPRRFRFDFAFPIAKGVFPGVAVEIDGGQFMVRYDKRGRAVPVGRHNQDSDRKKMNLAAELGWIVLHYTPEMIKKDPSGVVDQVLATLERFQ